MGIEDAGKRALELASKRDYKNLSELFNDYLPRPQEHPDGIGCYYSYSTLLSIGKWLVVHGGNDGKAIVAGMSALPMELRQLLLYGDDDALFQITSVEGGRYRLGSHQVYKRDRNDDGSANVLAHDNHEHGNLMWYATVQENGRVIFRNVRDKEDPNKALRAKTATTLTSAVVSTGDLDTTCEWMVCVSSEPSTRVGDTQSYFHFKAAIDDSRAFLTADSHRVRDGGSMFVSCGKFEPVNPLQLWTMNMRIQLNERES